MGDKNDCKLIKLENENYVVRKWQFKNVLKAKKLDKVLNQDEPVNDVMDGQAMALLGSGLSEENILKIINRSTRGMQLKYVLKTRQPMNHKHYIDV